MNITRALEDQNKRHCHENEAWASFYTVSLFLTLNNAFASLGNSNFLRTLNPKLPWTGWKFFERTCPVLQKKKKENISHHQFLFKW
jgi:hypothetical protein